MPFIHFFSTSKAQTYAGKSLNTLAVICIAACLIGITFFKDTMGLNSIAALVILAVAFWLPGLVLTDSANQAETN